MINTILFFAGILLAVLAGTYLKVNIGFTALAAAFLLGSTVGGLSAGAVVNLFPISLFLNFFLATFLFGFAARNGTLKKLAEHLIYRCRGAGWLLGLLFFAVTVIVSGLGAGGAAPFFISAICFSMAVQAGIHPLLVPLAVWSGSMVGGCVKWSSGYATNVGQLEIYFPLEASEQYVAQFFLFRAVFYTTLYLLMFVILKGFKPHRRNVYVEKPLPYDGCQKTTLAIILFVIAAVVAGSALSIVLPGSAGKLLSRVCSFQLLAVIGIVLNIVLKTADYDEVLKNQVPWDTLLMLSLCGVYMALAKSLGVVDFMAEVLQNRIPAEWILPGMVGVMCVLSFFVSGGVVVPMILPLIPALAAASGTSAAAVYCAAQMGLTASSISPFSQGGAAALTGCPDNELRKKLVRQQTVLSGVFSLLLLIVSLAGGFSWIQG